MVQQRRLCGVAPEALKREVVSVELEGRTYRFVRTNSDFRDSGATWQGTSPEGSAALHVNDGGGPSRFSLQDIGARELKVLPNKGRPVLVELDIYRQRKID